jgi:hypothetical protein
MSIEVRFVTKEGKILGEIDTDGTTRISKEWEKRDAEPEAAPSVLKKRPTSKSRKKKVEDKTKSGEEKDR